MKKRNILFRAALVSIFSMLAALVLSPRMYAVPSVTGKTTYIQSGHIWLSNADGTSPQQLTNDSALYANPVLSPDKQFIAAERHTGALSRIYIIPTDGSTKFLLSSNYRLFLGIGDVLPYEGSQYRPRWNPSSTRVAFYSVESVQPGSDPYRVYDAPLGGEGKEYRTGYNPEYSPDGTQLAYLDYRPEGDDYYWRVGRVVFATNEMMEAYRTPESIADFVWSPDSSTLLVLQQANSSQLLQILASRDHSLQQPKVFSDAVYTSLHDIAWSSDAQYIALIGEKDNGVQNVIRLTLSTGLFEELTKTQDENIQYSHAEWDITSRYLLVTYSPYAEAEALLIVVDTDSGSVQTVQEAVDTPDDSSGDNKDWQATYVPPQPQPQPQVLGTTSQEKTQSSQQASSQPSVLGDATTLPNTGFEKISSVKDFLGVMLVLVGLVTLLSARYVKKENC